MGKKRVPSGKIRYGLSAAPTHRPIITNAANLIAPIMVVNQPFAFAQRLPRLFASATGDLDTFPAAAIVDEPCVTIQPIAVVKLAPREHDIFPLRDGMRAEHESGGVKHVLAVRPEAVNVGAGERLKAHPDHGHLGRAQAAHQPPVEPAIGQASLVCTKYEIGIDA